MWYLVCAAVEASAACPRPLRAEDPMPPKAVEAAAIAPEPPAAAPKSFSRAALDAAAKALVAKRKAAHDAARWCVENGKGAKAAVKSGLFGDVKVVTYNVIEPLRKLPRRPAFSSPTCSRGRTSRAAPPAASASTSSTAHAQCAGWARRRRDGVWRRRRRRRRQRRTSASLSKRRRRRCKRQQTARPRLRSARRGARAGSCRARGPGVEAVPCVWAQEGPVQGQGMQGSQGAPPAGLQSCCGGAGGRRGGRVGTGLIYEAIVRRRAGRQA